MKPPEWSPVSPKASTTWFTRFRQNRIAVVGFIFLMAISLWVTIYPEWSRWAYSTEDGSYRFQQIHLDAASKNKSPSLSAPFGSDTLGRDVFERVAYGGRISLIIGFAAAIISLLVGLTWGLVAGYYRGYVDQLLMRLVDVLYGIPFLLLVSLFLAVSPSHSIIQLLVALGLIQWLTIARITRSQVLTIRTMPYVLVAKNQGASDLRIIVKHILPNVIGVAMVYTTLTIPTIILEEAFLSFLGLGIPADECSWGSLLAEGSRSLLGLEIYWWQLLFPAGFMLITLLSFNLLGDGIRDALDPKSQ